MYSKCLPVQTYFPETKVLKSFTPRTILFIWLIKQGEIIGPNFIVCISQHSTVHRRLSRYGEGCGKTYWELRTIMQIRL